MVSMEVISWESRKLTLMTTGKLWKNITVGRTGALGKIGKMPAVRNGRNDRKVMLSPFLHKFVSTLNYYVCNEETEDGSKACRGKASFDYRDNRSGWILSG